jgi:hypothetical protein
MIAMMNGINKTSFGGAQMVTCWTCHRGSGGPATTPSIDSIYSDPVSTPPDVLTQAKQGTVVPTATAIFDKYLQAIGGGPENLAKLTSYTAKGTSMLFGEDKGDAMELYAKAPNQLAITVHQREGDLARVTDGTSAWVMLPLTVVQEYAWTSSALEGAKLDGQMAFPGQIKDLFTNWRVSYPTTIDGRDIYVVQGSRGGMVATFYFDQKTGLLRRLVRYANSAVGRVPTQYDYSDYRLVAGVMMPFKWTFGWVSGREEYQLTEVTPNAPVDESRFAKPIPKPK